MPIAAYKQVLALKIESVVGTPETLADADCIKVYDLTVNPNIEIEERNYTDDVFTRGAHITVGKTGSIEFTLDLCGSGVELTPTPKWADILKVCGMVVDSDVFSFTQDTTDYKTCTVSVYHEGNVKTLAGAMGSFSIEGGAKQFGKVKVKLTGLWVSPIATVSFLNVAAGVTPPICNGGSLSWAGTNRTIEKFGIESGISVKPLVDMSKSYGYYRAWIDERKITATFDAEMLTGVSSWTDYEAGTERALAINIGSVAGNKIALAAAACQITSLEDAARDGVRIQNFTVAANGTSPLTITFS